jgi:cell division septal protein FtsQ
MAVTTKKRTTRAAPGTAAKKRRAVSTARRSRKGTAAVFNFFIPLVLMIVFAGCLGFLGVMGYRSVTASEFFEVRGVEVTGTVRVPGAEVEKIALSHSGKAGVWYTELDRIKADVEKLPYVRAAAVSRVLPDGIRVSVAERIPQAPVRLSGGDFWADDEGVILGPVAGGEPRPGFALVGWDVSNSDAANRDNRERVKLYKKVREEWTAFDLGSRVQEIDTSELNDLKATATEAGTSVVIGLGKDNYAKRLKSALEAIAGKGDRVKAVNARGVYPLIEFTR